MSWWGDIAPCLAKTTDARATLPPATAFFVPELMHLYEAPAMQAASGAVQRMHGMAQRVLGANDGARTAKHGDRGGFKVTRKVAAEFDNCNIPKPLWKVKPYAQDCNDRTHVIHDNSKALEIWERELNVVKHYREQLQEEGGAKALCQVIKTGADSRQTSVARFGPNAKCTGRNHAPGVTCYYCMTFPDRDKLKLKEETESYAKELIEMEKASKLRSRDRYSSPQVIAHLDAQLQDRQRQLQMLEQRRAQGVTAHQRRLWDKMGLKHADEDEEGEEAAPAKAGAISYGKARSRAKLEGTQGKTPWSKK